MKDDSERLLIRRIFPGYILTYLISSLGGCISSLVDSLVVSNLMTTNDLATMGIITPYYTILSMLGAFFYTGAQIQCSRALGNGERDKSDAWFSLTIEAALAVSCVIMLLCCLFSRQIAMAMGVSPDNAELMECVTAFNRGFFPNIPFSLLNSVLVMSANADGNKKTVSLSVAVTIIADAIGNLLAVTVFHAGLFGIALSTTIATFLADVVLAFHILQGKSVFHLKYTPVRLQQLINIWRYGLPKLTNKLLVIISTLLVNRLLLRIGGTIAMSSMSVLGALSHILLTPGTGIGSTAFLMSSVFYGEENSCALREVYRCILLYALGGIGIFAALLFAFASPVIGLFLREQGELYVCTVRALRIYAFSLPLLGLAEGMFGYIQGTGKTGISQLVTVATQFGRVAVMYMLAPFIGTDGVWWSFSFGALTGQVLCNAAILFIERRENATFSERLLLISSSVREAEKNSVYISVENEAEAAFASERIGSFCKEHGIDGRRTYFVSLCLEEMAKNVVRYGFRAGKKNVCAVRLVLRGANLILRIRDNCESFNTEEYFRQHRADADASSGIGIRLTCSVAKDVQYVKLLKTNTLIITL